MSTPTEVHFDLALQIAEALARSGNVAAAELIAASEARATAELRGALALGQQNCDDVYDELRVDCDELRADVVRLTSERDQLRAQLHALQLVCGTNDANKFQTWVDRANARAEKADAALTAEREKVRVLRHALENLCDEQNGAPLEVNRDQWQLAMDESRLALAATEESK
jgi:hypothetical protein